MCYFDVPRRFGRPLGGKGSAMRHGRCFRFRRTRAALCTGVIVAGMILVPSAGGRPLEAVPLGGFDSNGRDDSFLVAQSRPQGPVIKGSTATAVAGGGDRGCCRRSGRRHVRATGGVADHAHSRGAAAGRTGDVLWHRHQRCADRLLPVRHLESAVGHRSHRPHACYPMGRQRTSSAAHSSYC